MKRADAAKTILVDPSLDARIEGHALDAFRALWDRTVDDATLDPRSRLVTPAMVKDAVEARLRDVLGPGVLLPEVRVRLNDDRTGFVTEIRPAPVRRR